PVGVDVLGRAFEFGEGGDDAPAVVGLLVVDLEEKGLVGLDDERTIHARLPFWRRARHGHCSANRPVCLIAGPHGPERAVSPRPGGRELVHRRMSAAVLTAPRRPAPPPP